MPPAPIIPLDCEEDELVTKYGDARDTARYAATPATNTITNQPVLFNGVAHCEVERELKT
jgi:hypothetical protein